MPNPLISTPDRPHIKHVIMAYGVDVPTEVGYGYKKTERSKTKKSKDDSNATVSGTSSPPNGDEEEYDGVPGMKYVIWEEQQGELIEELKMSEPVSFTESILRKKKPKRRPLNNIGAGPRCV